MSAARRSAGRTPTRSGRSSCCAPTRGLIGLAAINFISQLAHVVLPSVFVLYAGYRYNWDATMVGITLAIVGACSMVVQAALIGPFVKRFGERRSALIGFACGAIGFAIYGLAPTGYLSWLGIPLQAMWGLSDPSIQALMSRVVSPTEQGQLQGANTSVAAWRSSSVPASLR